MDEEQNPLGHMSARAREAVSAARIIMYDQKFMPVFAKVLTASTGLAPTVAMLTFTILQKLDEKGMDLEPAEIYGDRGVAEAIVAYLFGFAKSIGVPEADDQAKYDEANDLVDDMAVQAVTDAEGGEQMQGPMGPAQMQPQPPPPQGQMQQPGLMAPA